MEPDRGMGRPPGVMRKGLLGSSALEIAVVHFGWLPFFVAVAWIRPDLLTSFLVLVFFLNYGHRHITLAFVYGDPEEFRRRRFAYLLLPLTLVLLTALVVKMDALNALVGVSGAWTVYHVLAQKFGFLRIYRATSGATTHRRLEQLFVFGGVLHAAAIGIPMNVLTLRRYGLHGLVDLYQRVSPELALNISIGIIATYTTLGVALFARWFRAPRRNLMYPVYLLSIYASYTCVALSLVAGYAAFAMSHAVEYFVFTGAYTKRNTDFPARSFMSFLSRRSVFVLTAMAAAIGFAILYWRDVSPTSLKVYIAGSSFLHFVYDGWLWKLRNKEVGRVLFASPASAP